MWVRTIEASPTCATSAVSPPTCICSTRLIPILELNTPRGAAFSVSVGPGSPVKAYAALTSATDASKGTAVA
jgi:hypothetical protein